MKYNALGKSAKIIFILVVLFCFMEVVTLDPQFLEVSTVEEANAVSTELYSFITFSNSRNCYIFRKRTRKPIA